MSTKRANSRVRTSCRAGGLLLAAVWTLVPLPAAFWQSADWNLTGELGLEAGYDTNLNARRDNLESSFATITPALRLARQPSATRFETIVAAEQVFFFNEDDLDAFNPSVRVVFERPWGEGIRPTQDGEFYWDRATSANADLGRRVRSENLRLQWDGVLRDTGKTVLRGGLGARSADFRADDLNTNQSLALNGEIGYAVSELLHAGVGYGHTWARSQGRLGRGDTYSNENNLTVRARGDLLPKLTGSAHAGVAFIDYRGAVDRSETEWIGGVALEWQATERFQALVRASRFADFGPAGETALRSALDVEMKRGLGRGFALRAGGGLSRRDGAADGATRDATAVTLLAGLDYQLTERFSAGLADRWTQQFADRADLDFERHQLTARAQLRF